MIKYINKYPKFSFFILLILALLLGYKFYIGSNINVSIYADFEKPLEFQIFYSSSSKKSFNEENSVRLLAEPSAGKKISIKLPIHKLKLFRLDLGQNPGNVQLEAIKISGKNTVFLDDWKDFNFYNIERQTISNQTITILSDHVDPFIIYKNPLNIKGNASIHYGNLALIIFGVTALYTLFCFRTFIFRLSHKNWLSEFVNQYKNINPLYKKTFWTTFIALNIVFLYHTVHFLWGNHDFGTVDYGINWKEAFHQGRFTAFLMQQLFGGQVLPIINNLVYFAGLSCSALMLCYYWRLPRMVSVYVPVSLFLVLLPYTSSWLYYIHMTITCGWLPFIVILALQSADKIKEVSSTAHKTILFAVSSLLIFYALSAYTSVINNIAIILGGRIFIEWLQKDINFKSLYQSVFSHFYVFLSGLCGSFLFAAAISVAKKQGIFIPAYNAQTASLSEIPQKFILAFTESFKTLFYTYPFMTFTLKMILLFIVLAAVLSTFYHIISSKPKIHCIAKLFAMGLFWIALLFVTQLVLVVAASSDVANAVRIQFFGLAYFYTLCVAVIFILGRQPVQNIGGLAIATAIIFSIAGNLHIQKVWKFAFDNEIRIQERLLERIEEKENFLPSKKYTYVQIGLFPHMATKFYYKPYDKKASELLNFSYQPGWIPQIILNFLSKSYFIGSSLWVDQVAENYNSDMDKELSDFIMNKAKVWPHKDSVYVSDNYILVVANKTELDKVKERIKKDFLRKGR